LRFFAICISQFAILQEETMHTITIQGLGLAEETMPVLIAEPTEEDAAQKENAPESAALEAFVACATFHLQTEYSTEPSACQIAVAPKAEEIECDLGKAETATDVAALASSIEYSTEPPACQIATAPTLEEIGREIAAAARLRIDAALRDLNETHARIERERTARDVALKAMQERASKTRTELDGLAGERTAMERRAQTFLIGDALKDTQTRIHLAFNVRQLELEDALALAEADAQEMQTQIQAALISDALELQLAEQYLAQLETAAPDVAENVRLAATAQENLDAARQAVSDGLLHDAEVLLEKAKAGNAEPTQIGAVEQMLADARKNQTARDLMARINAVGDQPGAVRRIKQLVDEAETAGVANRVASAANRAFEAARRAANARYAQARPIADHLVAEGLMPVIADGRIEAWKTASHNGIASDNGNGNGNGWMLDHVLVLRANGVWATEKPHVAVTRKELAPHARRSRWYRAWKKQPPRAG
jgi:hypothetical protein